jgi:DnaJ family protein A protein 2
MKGDLLTIKGKGMPFYKDAMSHGDLHIKFTVEFPKSRSLKPEVIEKLTQVHLYHYLQSLPAPPKANRPDPKKSEILEEFDETSLNSNAEGGKCINCIVIV